MNQNKYSRLSETLKKCGILESDKLVLEFKQFMKYQKINKDIDNMIDEAHNKKISDEEFKAMIDEQKKIMKDLGIRNIKFKEPPSSVSKPKLPNDNTLSNNTLSNNTLSNNTLSNNTLSNESSTNNLVKINNKVKTTNTKPQVVQVFNITDIKNYDIQGNKYIFYGTNNKVVEKIRLETGLVKNVNQLSKNELENISEDIEVSVNTEIFQPLDPLNKKTLKLKPKPNNAMIIPPKKKSKKHTPQKKTPPKPQPKKKSTPKKKTLPKKNTLPKKKSPVKCEPIGKSKPKRKSKTNLKNRYWYHQLPDHPMKNKSKVKGKRRRIVKKPVNKPMVNKKSKSVPFKGFFDMLKI
jgi:hypothetical protein